MYLIRGRFPPSSGLKSEELRPMKTTPRKIVAPSSQQRWTKLHIALHWLVVVLIVGQFLDSESMVSLFDGSVDGTAVDSTTRLFGYLHMTTGIVVFAAICARIWDRRVHGCPPHPSGEPNWAAKLAAITQTLLYVTLLAMPIAGLVTWLTENGQLGDLHVLAAKALLGLLALHVAGALANHFWFKTDVLRRMMPGQGR